MNRHPALQDLSRDHFVALNHVVKARRMHEGDRFAEPLVQVHAAFVALWPELEPHFDEEEEMLLPLLESLAGGEQFGGRLRVEHGQLRQAFLELAAAEPDTALLWNTAEALRIHIRWEEEHLFQALQDGLSQEALMELADRSQAFRLARRGPASIGPGRHV